MTKREEMLFNKIENEEILTESELYDLLDFEIEKITGENRRWSRFNHSIIKLNDNLYMLGWDEGLTEGQDDMFDEQPIKIRREKKTETVILDITEYIDEKTNKVVSSTERVVRIK